MATVVDWNSLGGEEEKGSGNGRGKKYLLFEPGKIYTVRPVGRAFEFFKFFVKPVSKSVVVDTESVDAAAAMISQEFGIDAKAKHSYAINVIDREDNKIKVMEGGKMIFKQFALWAKGNNTHPGGMSGGDWLIQVVGDGMSRKYNAQCIRPAPLSADEMKRVKDKNEMHDLEAMYVSVPLNKLIATLKGDKNSDEPNDVAHDLPKAKGGQPVTVPAENNADDDLF
jgi:hypothetical protein